MPDDPRAPPAPHGADSMADGDARTPAWKETAGNLSIRRPDATSPEASRTWPTPEAAEWTFLEWLIRGFGVHVGAIHDIEGPTNALVDAMHKARAQMQGEADRLRAELDERETPLCEFCTTPTEGGAMHVCCACWNGANNDTWQRRALHAEAERDVALTACRNCGGPTVREERCERCDRALDNLSKEIARLTAARAALQEQGSTLEREIRRAAADCRLWLGVPCQSASTWHAATYDAWADHLAALLTKESL